MNFLSMIMGLRRPRTERPGGMQAPEVPGAPAPGERWFFKQETPFGTKVVHAKVREVRDGWVLYDLGAPFNGQTMPVNDFMKVYGAGRAT